MILRNEGGRGRVREKEGVDWERTEEGAHVRSQTNLQ